MTDFRVIYHEPICPECGSFDIEDRPKVDTGDGLTETAHIRQSCGAAWPLSPASPTGPPPSALPIPYPPPSRDKAVTPHAQDHQSPPQPAEQLLPARGTFASFHTTTAGAAWRCRTELATMALLAAVLRRLTLLITITWAALVLAAPLAWSWPCRTPAGSSPGGSRASWPATASSDSAMKPGCTPGLGGFR